MLTVDFNPFFIAGRYNSVINMEKELYTNVLYSRLMTTEEFREVFQLLNGAESDWEEFDPDAVKSDRVESLDSAWSGVYDAIEVLERMKGTLSKMLKAEENS